MDGNGRWASKKGMPRSYGHKVGVERVTAFSSDINYFREDVEFCSGKIESVIDVDGDEYPKATKDTWESPHGYSFEEIKEIFELIRDGDDTYDLNIECYWEL